MKWAKSSTGVGGLAHKKCKIFVRWKYQQGNFDPSRLLSPIPVIKKMVNEMIDEFGKTNTLQTLDMVFCQIFLWITLKHL
jgi:uroporphyrinogen-III decarboxylase